jgi:type III secretion protein T
MSAAGAFDQVLVLGVAITRIATAFALTPLLSRQVAPTLVRNSLFVAFGLIVLLMQPAYDPSPSRGGAWLALFAREAVIGLFIGFFFGGVLWAFEAAGQIIDAKIGAAMAQVSDPFSGLDTTLNGAVLGRLANLAFMASGGLLVFVSAILSSYVIWPLDTAAPHLRPADLNLFEDEFARIMAIAVGFAAPALAVLTVVEGGMGLLNRFAPQLNVFAASLPIKAWLATLVVLATLGLMVDTIVNETAGRGEIVLQLLRAMSR